jgi:DNA-directed RNA polymerase subunit RPC12/RpoP
MLKIIILIVIGYVVYKTLFSAKPPINANNKNEKIEEDELVECVNCGIFVSQKEAILTTRGYMCKECYDSIK